MRRGSVWIFFGSGWSGNVVRIRADMLLCSVLARGSVTLQFGYVKVHAVRIQVEGGHHSEPVYRIGLELYV